MKLKAAILVDDLSISKWQEVTLGAARDRIDIVLILNCQNTKTKKHYAKNALYYCLNVIALRNELTKKSSIEKSVFRLFSVKSCHQQTWSELILCFN